MARVKACSERLETDDNQDRKRDRKWNKRRLGMLSRYWTVAVRTKEGAAAAQSTRL
ncbi:hypothetical protein TSUD_365570 [Trifolium subterraneum]|uniref:Uncharacterized protein n=1 Tax=Trifolium subterraneum TaxID=3900 RepID=A0A2Z6NRM4_TRISU|nr:hypothetical protein TSUD_365570 [Trifolium subterraneum]